MKITLVAPTRLAAEQAGRLAGYNLAGNAVPGTAPGTWVVPIRRWPKPIR